jgi:hypothetical protein
MFTPRLDDKTYAERLKEPHRCTSYECCEPESEYEQWRAQQERAPRDPCCYPDCPRPATQGDIYCEACRESVDRFAPWAERD